MGSKLGFGRLLSNFKSMEKSFLTEGITLAKDEIKKNFDNQINSETGEIWNEVVRDVPPPILDVTSKLKEDSLRSGNTVFSSGKAVITIDPVDERGKGYASYHQDGENQYRTKDEFQREFVTQSDELTEKQINCLKRNADKLFGV